MPANVASIIGELLDTLDDAAELRDDGGSVEPFLKRVDDFLDELRNGVNAARRLVQVEEDRLKLLGDPDGWETLGAPYNDPDHLSRAYLPVGRAPKAFQVAALAALEADMDVLLAVPCGAGKTMPPAMFAAHRASLHTGMGSACFSVWLCATQLLVQDKVRDFNARFEAWLPEDDDSFAVAVESRGAKRDAFGVVYGDVGSNTPLKRRHPVLQKVQDGETFVGALVLTPEMFAVCQAWFCLQAAEGHVSCFVIDEADDETGVLDSYRRDQSRQGALVRAAVAAAARKGITVPVVALSGTVASGDLNRLKADLRLSENAYVVRTAPQSTHVELKAAEVETADARLAAWTWVTETLPPNAAGLIFAFRKSTIEGIVKDLRKREQGTFVAIHGGVVNEDKRQRLRVWVEDEGVVAVVNEAGHRGVDHPELRYALIVEPPSNVPSFLQLIGRAARGATQRGEIVVAVDRAKYVHVASCFREDPRKLAEFVDVVRVLESVEKCWRSVAAVCLGDERASGADAVARRGCCPACSAQLAASRSGGKAYVGRDVAEIAALLDEDRRAAARTRDQATFKALTRGRLHSWGQSYSPRARERVVLSLLCDGVLRFDAARLPAQCVRFVVNEAVAATRRRDRRSDIVCFRRGEVPDDTDDVFVALPSADGGGGDDDDSVAANSGGGDPPGDGVDAAMAPTTSL